MAELAKDICEKLKHLGYSRSKHIHLYGESFQLVSDPFPLETGVAVEVVARNSTARRVVKLPLPVLKTAMQKPA